MVSFGAEGLVWPSNGLFMVNNTLVNDYAGTGEFLRVFGRPTRLVVYNNLLIGKYNAPLDAAVQGEFAGNFAAARNELVAPDSYDYRLNKDAYSVARAITPPTDAGTDLRPDREYVHPRRLRRLCNSVYSPGAQQTLGS